MSAGYPHSAPVRDANERDVLDRIDARVRDVALSIGGHEMHYPVLIARDIVEQADYPRAFPHLLLSAARSECVRTAWCLSPAVCYHTYAQFAGRVLDGPTVITARGACFRAETVTEPGVRQIEFEMREIVFLGAPASIDAAAEATKHTIETHARELGLDGSWQPAEDPFFLPVAKHKAVAQRLLKTKFEYQWPRAGGLALTSINRHGAFFGQRFGIVTANGEPAHTICIAVGLDRWAAQAAAIADGRSAREEVKQ